MTESEWLTCTDPDPMLAYLRTRASSRKLRLFACACARRGWDLLTDERSRRAVEVAERYADGEADKIELANVSATAWEAWRNAAEAAACDVVNPNSWTAAMDAAKHASWATKNYRADELTILASLLRDLFNPFLFRPMNLNAPVLKWNDNTVVRLARSMYDDTRFEEVPILGDALEEAGCQDADILGHCRNPGPHVRGCWLVDLLLEKRQLR